MPQNPRSPFTDGGWTPLGIQARDSTRIAGPLAGARVVGRGLAKKFTDSFNPLLDALSHLQGWLDGGSPENGPIVPDWDRRADSIAADAGKQEQLAGDVIRILRNTPNRTQDSYWTEGRVRDDSANAAELRRRFMRRK